MDDEVPLTAEAGPGPEGAEGGEDAAKREAELLDRLQRLAADFENYKKRVRRDEEERAKQAALAAVAPLVDLLDDLDRALDHGDDASTSLAEGVRLVRKRLWGLLESHGVKTIDAAGKAFDPRLHEAVARVPACGEAAGAVLEVVRPGYLLGDRLLRPALVKVAEAEIQDLGS